MQKLIVRIGNMLTAYFIMVSITFLIAIGSIVFFGLRTMLYDRSIFLTLLGLLGASFVIIIPTAWITYIFIGRMIRSLKTAIIRQIEFMAGASHEIRTPLSLVLTSLDTVLRDSSNRFSPFSLQVLEDMRQEIFFMSKTLQHFTFLARSDLETSDLHFEQTNLNTIVEQLIRGIMPLAQNKKINLNYFLSANIIVYADVEHLRRVLFILLDNGIKYTPAGGNVSLTAYVDQEVKKVIITVTDNGIGIPSQHIDHIFKRFYRWDQPGSPQTGGSGLGLYLAKAIVELHHGTIKADSTPQHGSVFTVTLPLQ